MWAETFTAAMWSTPFAVLRRHPSKDGINEQVNIDALAEALKISHLMNASTDRR